MTKLLSITAHPDAPVACDMTDAEDTLADRIAEYRRLFEHALLAGTPPTPRPRSGSPTSPGVRDWVLDLVRREAACCPFLSYEVDLDRPTTRNRMDHQRRSAPPTWPCSTSSWPVRPNP